MAAEETLIEEVADAPKRTRTARKGEVESLSGKRVKLTIHKDSSPRATARVFVALNFVGYDIERGKEVVVPWEVAEILKSSTEILYEQKGDQLITREVPSYAITIEPL
jgi:hypothetical protein